MRFYRENDDFLESVIYGMDMDDAFEFILKKLISKMDNNATQMLLGICFSEEGDLLGQWREYADKGTGFAIGFDIEWFQKLCNDNNLFRFSKIDYGYLEDDPRIKKYAEEIYNEIILTMLRGNTKELIDDYSNIPYMINLKKECLFQESIFLKGNEYKNEKEWRLILDDENIRKDYDEWDVYYNWKNYNCKSDREMIYELLPNAMEFMTRSGRIVPYVDLKFDLDKRNIPIRKVIIGPNCKVNDLDVYHLLNFYGFDGNEIEITRSKSSYCIYK